MGTTRRSLLLSAPFLTLLPGALRGRRQDSTGSFTFREAVANSSAFLDAVRAGRIDEVRAMLEAIYCYATAR